MFTTCLCGRDYFPHCISEPSRGMTSPCYAMSWWWIPNHRACGGAGCLGKGAKICSPGLPPQEPGQLNQCVELVCVSWTSPWLLLGLNIPIWTDGGWGSMVQVSGSGTLSSVHPLSTMEGWHRALPAFKAVEGPPQEGSSEHRELRKQSVIYEDKALWEQSHPLGLSSHIPEVNNLPLGRGGEENKTRLGSRRPGFQLGFVTALQCVPHQVLTHLGASLLPL